MKLFIWKIGRQSNIQYSKYCFLYFNIFHLIYFDAYILKYEPNQQLPIHKDPVYGLKHYRLNVKLKGKCKFWCTSEIFKFGEFIHLFRSDLFYHNVVTYTKVYKLSFGIFVKSKNHGT